MNSSHDELIQQVLDGRATPGDRTRLDALMQHDPELRQRYDAMASLFAVLRSDPIEDAPADLRDSVLRSLPAGAPAAADLAGASRRPRPAAMPWARFALPLTAAAAAVLLIVLALRTVPSPFAPDARTAATMSGAPPRAVLLELGVEGSGVRVAASRDEAGAGHLEITSDSPVRITVSSVRGSIEFAANEVPSDGHTSVPPVKDRLEWYLKPGVTLHVACAAPDASPLLSLRAASPGGTASEVRIHLESLPTLRAS